MSDDLTNAATNRRREQRAVIVLTGLPLIALCCWLSPVPRLAHTLRLRRFADHEAIRAACLELLRRSPTKTGRVADADVPDVLRRLGSRCHVELLGDRVMVDVGSYWVDSYGFMAAEEGGAPWERSGVEVIPGLYWWDAGL